MCDCGLWLLVNYSTHCIAAFAHLFGDQARWSVDEAKKLFTELEKDGQFVQFAVTTILFEIFVFCLVVPLFTKYE